jgi:tRNA pseudouridine synthase 10
MAATKGVGHKLHGMGLEDIDARCLAWRPFVFEILEPKKRDIDIKKLAKKIGKQVRVKDIRYSDIAEVRKIKETQSNKSYCVTVTCEKAIKKEELKKISSLIGTINQRTPLRVTHRRADKERKKKVMNIKAKMLNSRTFKLFVTCSAGLYIKELVTGDDGRTQPSIASLLGIKCVPKDLDVTGIDAK